MKIRGVILLLILALSLFQYLGSEKYPWPIGEESALPAAGENLRLTVADTITPAGGMFTLWNSTMGTVPVGGGIHHRDMVPGGLAHHPAEAGARLAPDPLGTGTGGALLPGGLDRPLRGTAPGALPAGEALFPKTALSFLPV